MTIRFADVQDGILDSLRGRQLSEPCTAEVEDGVVCVRDARGFPVMWLSVECWHELQAEREEQTK